MTDTAGTTPQLLAGHIARAGLAATKLGRLSIWTIYDKPKDFPAGYIARRHETGGTLRQPLATADAVTGSLHSLRESLKLAGLTRIPRDAADDANIVESWL